MRLHIGKMDIGLKKAVEVASLHRLGDLEKIQVCAIGQKANTLASHI